MWKMSFVMLACVCVWAVQGEVLANSPPVVSNVTASQRTDGSNLVDIRYNLYDADGDLCTVFLRISSDDGATWKVPALTVWGHVGENISPGASRHIIWDVGRDAPGLVGGNFKARVIADDGNHLAEMSYVSAGLFRTSTGVWVYMDDYYIDTFEVTNQFYCMFLNSGGQDDRYRQSAEIERNGIEGHYTYRPIDGFENRPVRWVTWYDTVAFCNWRSEAEGLPVGTYHLPTEAQWEKAAGWDPGAGKLWTYGFQSDEITPERANYNRNVGTTTDVGSYHPWRSYYGLYDASGNVWEWCSDWYEDTTYPSSTSNPTGPTSGSYKVIRGGSWSNIAPASCVETGSRYSDAPSLVPDSYGFRCARTLE